MKKPCEIIKGNSRIRIGYRSPGLSNNLNSDGKMELCRGLGMAVIEPQIVEREFPDLASAEKYKKSADKHGITICSAGILLPYSDPEATNDDCLGNFELQVAEMLQVDYVFTLVKHPPEGICHQESWDLVVSRLRLFIDKAREKGFRVALEPEWFLGSSERVVRMLKAVDRLNFQLINFDATNFYLNGSDPCDVIENYCDRIISGHIKDGYYQTNKRCESAIGDGEVEWRKIFALMLEKGGDYTMHIEHCNKPEQVIAAEKFIRAELDALK